MSAGSWRAPESVGRARRQCRIGDQSNLGLQCGRGNPKRRQAWRDRRRSAARLTNETAGHFGRRLITRRGGRAIRAAIVRRSAHLPNRRCEQWAIDIAHGVRGTAGGERDNHKCREPDLAHDPTIFDLDHQLVKTPRLLIRTGRRWPFSTTCGRTPHRSQWINLNAVRRGLDPALGALNEWGGAPGPMAPRSASPPNSQ